MKRLRVIGLTGGIATGKSSVARLFASLGATVIDADEHARRVVQPGSPALKALVEEFGPSILKPDGELDRARLAECIFSDPEKRRRVDEIMHPHIAASIAQAVEEAVRKSQAPVLILDVPLLFESGRTLGLVDETVVVYADRETEKRRLMKRDGVDEAEAERRIDAQWPIEEKVRLADHVIDNSGTWEATRRQVLKLWKEWEKDAHRSDRS